MSKFTREVTLGINITVKSLSKKYPFIIGWEFDGDIEKYEYSTFINLIIDKQKVSEYYDRELVERTYNEVSVFSSIFSKYDPFEQKDDWQREFDFFYKEKQELENDLNRFYEYVPEGYKILSPYKVPVNIKIIGFILK